ncbi:hypothetical protein G419_01975 [Rhodococcus triatomae BKS 15-14]|nr:hypothetical protein G419_01975 [Rhodococcus triatomae BKS 15-14]
MRARRTIGALAAELSEPDVMGCTVVVAPNDILSRVPSPVASDHLDEGTRPRVERTNRQVFGFSGLGTVRG